MIVQRIEKNSIQFDHIIEFLMFEYDKGKRNYQFWQNRFLKSKSDRIGYALIIENKIEGFLGTISRDNEITGLSVWFVKYEWRNLSISFLIRCLELLKDEPIINSSPNPLALKIFSKLKGFNLKFEFIGIPNKIFTLSKPKATLFHGTKVNLICGNNISILYLFYLSLRKLKLHLELRPEKDYFILSKKINVLHRNIQYQFPLSIYGDIIE